MMKYKINKKSVTVCVVIVSCMTGDWSDRDISLTPHYHHHHLSVMSDIFLTYGRPRLAHPTHQDLNHGLLTAGERELGLRVHQVSF